MKNSLIANSISLQNASVYAYVEECACEPNSNFI